MVLPSVLLNRLLNMDFGNFFSTVDVDANTTLFVYIRIKTKEYTRESNTVHVV
jgi:hypothetical protein